MKTARPAPAPAAKRESGFVKNFKAKGVSAGWELPSTPPSAPPPAAKLPVSPPQESSEKLEARSEASLPPTGPDPKPAAQSAPPTANLKAETPLTPSPPPVISPVPASQTPALVPPPVPSVALVPQAPPKSTPASPISAPAAAPVQVKPVPPAPTLTISNPKNPESGPAPLEIQNPKPETQDPKTAAAVPPSQSTPPLGRDQGPGTKGQAPKTKDKTAIAAAAVAAKVAAAEKQARARRPLLASPTARMIFLVLFAVIAAVSLYYFTRETRLTIHASGGDITLYPEAQIVFNFSGKISMLRRDYQNRQQPLIQQVDDQQLQLISARGDLAGRQQRKKLLDDALAQYQKEIPDILREGQEALDRFWNQEGEALKKEYRDTLEALHQEIADRAQTLGIAYTRNPDLDAIEVAANAFRLALYNAPTGVQVDEQRRWVEGILARWKEFESRWIERQLQLRDKAMAIKQEPGPKVAATEERIASLRLEIEALSIEIQALEAEVATYEERLKEAQQSLEATIQPFMQELLNIPGQFEHITLQLPASGPLELRDLQERSDLAPGTYTLLVRGTREGQEYWAMKKFTINAYKKNTVSIQPGDFVPARSLLLPQDSAPAP